MMRRSLVVDWRQHIAFVSLLILFFYAFLRFYNMLVNATVVGMQDEVLMVNLGIYGFLKIMITLFFIAVVTGFCSAHSFYFLGTGNAAHAALMFKASDIERFAVVLTHSFLIAVIDSFLAFAIADILQWVVTGAFPVNHFSDIDWNYVQETKALPAGTETLMQKSIAAAAILILFCSAWFSLCATLFRRHPFIFGMLLLWVMTQFVSLALCLVVGFSLDFGQWNKEGIDNAGIPFLISKLGIFVNWVMAVTSLATLLLWTASYKRMKKVAKAIYE